MTAAEKFAVCKAMFDSRITYPPPHAAHQYRMAVNSVSDAVCLTFDEARAFRSLCEKDNWLDDNPFRDDP